ncbi:GNAT family N-acetyltransferase [Alkalihalobacillus sp. 1P02AB]|uniref:GNAT family N-acetyltransferase n=1 Tax=Alkalihalobacillus sp. 1P02AB TaxID=3132260 RepID=UPI0039A5EB0F
MGDLTILPMNQKYAFEILQWRYPKPYDFYNIYYSNHALSELLEENYFAVVNQNNGLVGFFCTGRSSQVPSGVLVKAYENDCTDVGLGIKPHLTGRGNGYDFCSFIFSYIQKQKTSQTSLRLTVATFNQRAIRLYKKLGFIKDKQFHHHQIEFMTMVKPFEKESIIVHFIGKEIIL